MSQISLKSISGITSITTPAGVDNRFSLYNFDSTERLVLDHSGNLNISGVTTATNFKTGSSNLHSTGLTVGDTFLHSTGVNLGTGATVSNNGNATFSGIVTASQFKGDGSELTGVASRDFYGFEVTNENLFVKFTNGVDDISSAENASFREDFIGPTGYTFSINSAGELEMTI